MKPRPLILITLIISHMLVNVVWASSHKGVDIKDANNMPHLHFYSHGHDHSDAGASNAHDDSGLHLLISILAPDYHSTVFDVGHTTAGDIGVVSEASETTPDADLSGNHDHTNEPHICLVFQVSSLFSMIPMPIQTAKPASSSWQSVTFSLTPPVPPPLA
ncbi:Uncharacterised protein [BD1-7 clade bacterium]|uniref:Uncharacterized protein n=1 Tax=BD1-7 clade bacterium TaxID=2029982 RepID=A0A5S9PMA6_9GAMM|nr:Uncharacterised protein [BD1-7 clade bacterium]CAA0105189.1 Uncharacterised protein [BD1-7 clade bacterium]